MLCEPPANALPHPDINRHMATGAEPNEIMDVVVLSSEIRPVITERRIFRVARGTLLWPTAFGLDSSMQRAVGSFVAFPCGILGSALVALYSRSSSDAMPQNDILNFDAVSHFPLNFMHRHP